MSDAPKTVTPNETPSAALIGCADLFCPTCRQRLPPPSEKQRTCEECKILKPIEEFSKTGKLWRMRKCKSCSPRKRYPNYDREQSENLTDHYVRNQLAKGSKLKASDFPPELVTLKRAQIKLSRSLKGKAQ